MNLEITDTGRYNVAAMRALDLARREEWDDAIPKMLALLAESESQTQRELPESLLSYLGYGIASHQARYRDGLALCERAVRAHFYTPDNFYNLARTLLLRNAKRRAIDAIARGLQIDPRHRGLLELYTRLGKRQTPVLRFLPRSHWLNRLLGRSRARTRDSP